jgi:hypothetical protein
MCQGCLDEIADGVTGMSVENEAAENEQAGAMHLGT